MKVRVWSRFDLDIIMIIALGMMFVGAFIYPHRNFWLLYGGLVLFILTLFGSPEMWKRKVT